MIFLGVDTSYSGVSLFLKTPAGRKVEISSFTRKPGGEDIVAVFKRALEALSLKSTEIKKTALITGPGSFTGLRIGMAFAKGLVEATRSELRGVNALYAMAWKYRNYSEYIFSVRDARNNDYYCGLFKSEKNGLKPLFMTETVKLDSIELGFRIRETLIVGEGRKLVGEILSKKGVRCNLCGNRTNEPVSSCLAELWDDPQSKTLDVSTAVPEYFKLSPAGI